MAMRYRSPSDDIEYDIGDEPDELPDFEAESRAHLQVAAENLTQLLILDQAAIDRIDSWQRELLQRTGFASQIVKAEQVADKLDRQERANQRDKKQRVPYAQVYGMSTVNVDW